MWNTFKKHPLSSQGVYSSFLYVNGLNREFGVDVKIMDWPDRTKSKHCTMLLICDWIPSLLQFLQFNDFRKKIFGLNFFTFFTYLPYCPITAYYQTPSWFINVSVGVVELLNCNLSEESYMILMLLLVILVQRGMIVISTEGALRLPTTYDNHPSNQPHPIPQSYIKATFPL